MSEKARRGCIPLPLPLNNHIHRLTVTYADTFLPRTQAPFDQASGSAVWAMRLEGANGKWDTQAQPTAVLEQSIPLLSP